jgi:hypothetical protein
MSNLQYLNAKSRRYHKALQHVNDSLYLVFSDDLARIGYTKLDEYRILTKAAVMALKHRATMALTIAEVDPADAAYIAQTIVSKEEIVRAFQDFSNK